MISLWTISLFYRTLSPAPADGVFFISVEMRHSVTTPAYMIRKMFDNALFSFSSKTFVNVASLSPLLSRVPFAPGAPSGWIPLYTMVTFRPDISYANVKRKAEKQHRVVTATSWIGTAILGLTGLGITWVSISHRLGSQR